jgi:hypothetical protein
MKVQTGLSFVACWASLNVSLNTASQRVDRVGADVKSEGEGALHVAKNLLDLCEMWLVGIMHEETDLLNRVGQVGAGQCQVLKGTSKTPVEGGVGNRGAVRSRQLGTSAHRSRGRVTLSHAGTLKKILGVLSLRQKQATGGVRDGDTEEVMQCAKICHGEL